MLRLIVSLTFLAGALSSTVVFSAAPSAQAVPGYVSPPLRPSVVLWLSQHPDFRLATDADCSCDDDIANLRTGDGGWAAMPGYHPYYVTGDFRGDGVQDVAVGVIASGQTHRFRVLIIHGARLGKKPRAAFLSEELTLGLGLFYGPPRPKPWRLGVGPFESEGVLFEPTKDGYEISVSAHTT